MDDITELERRITSALDRIGAGLDGIGSADTSSAEVARLREALETEQTANSQLEERVRAIRDRQEKTVGALEAEVARLRQTTGTQEGELQKLRQVNAQLRENNRALRDANQQGLGDADLINAAIKTELDALRANQGADRAELDAILGELRPLLERDVNA